MWCWHTARPLHQERHLPRRSPDLTNFKSLDREIHYTGYLTIATITMTRTAGKEKMAISLQDENASTNTRTTGQKVIFSLYTIWSILATTKVRANQFQHVQLLELPDFPLRRAFVTRTTEYYRQRIFLR